MDVDFLKSIGLDDESVAQKILEKHKEEETGLVNKRDELLGKMSSMKEQLAQYDGVDLDEYSKLRAKMKELDEKNLMDKGEFDTLLSQKQQEWENQLNERDDKYNTLAQQYREELEDKAVLTAVGDKGDGDLILDVIKRRGLVQAVDKDGKFVLQVKNLDGDKELDSISALIDEMKGNEKYQRLFNSSGLSGGGARQSGSTSTQGNDKLFGAQRMAAARQGK